MMAEFILNLNERPRLSFCNQGEFGGAGRRCFMLPELWGVHLYFYHTRLCIVGTWYDIAPGTLSFTPAGTQSEYLFPEGTARHYGLHMRVADGDGSGVVVPAVYQLGDGMPRFQKHFETLTWMCESDRLRAEVKLWNLLLDFAADYGEQRAPNRIHPAIQRVLQAIHSNDHATLTLPYLAQEAELTQVHLNRLFKAFTGTTVMAYVRQLRLAKAKHLLTESTLPIKAVAETIGIYDLHAFNKQIRQAYGKSPRALRNQAHVL